MKTRMLFVMSILFVTGLLITGCGEENYNTYSVSFNSGGANIPSSPTNMTVTEPETTLSVLPEQPVLTGHLFGGWWTGTNGTGMELTIDTVISNDLTVYAQWTIKRYTISYNRNGATSGKIPVLAQIHDYGTTITVFENRSNLIGPYIRDGIRQRFLGWHTSASSNTTLYSPGDSFSLTNNVTLYAVYTSDSDAVCKIGPAGGYVFYDAGSVQSWGRYLEAAPTDATNTTIRWSNGTNIETGATETGIGSGMNNTIKITNTQGPLFNSYAAGIASTYSAGGFEDWFLPSLGSLGKMHNKLKINGLGNFARDYYCPSTELSSTLIKAYSFKTTTLGYINVVKNSKFRVRPVRAF